MSGPVRIGIAGYGAFGRFLHAAWRAVDGVEVVAVATPEPVDAGPGVDRFATWEALLASARLDLVAVALPPHLHAPVALAALAAGCDVLVEKPLALTLDDAEALRVAAEASGRTVAVNFLMRHTPIVEALHALAHSGRFGPLRRVVVENHAQDQTLGRDHWFWDVAQSGGILVEHAVHFLDVVHGCGVGAPVQVDGVRTCRSDGREDRVLLSALYASGTLMTQHHAFTRPAFFEETSARFVFDALDLSYDGWIPLSGRLRALVDADAEAALSVLPGLHVTARTPLGPRDAPGGGAVVSGVAYPATHAVEATFALATSKHDAYVAGVQAVLRDLVAARSTPGHRVRTGIPEGTASLAVAAAVRTVWPPPAP